MNEAEEDWREARGKWPRREEEPGCTVERGRSEERRSKRSAAAAAGEKSGRRGGAGATIPIPRKRFRTDDFLPDLKPSFRSSSDEKVYISVKEIQVAKKKIALLEDENKSLKRGREEMEKDFARREEVLKRGYEEQFKRHKEDISRQGNLIQLCQREINELKKVKEDSESHPEEKFSILATNFAERQTLLRTTSVDEKKSKLPLDRFKAQEVEGSQVQVSSNIKEEAVKFNEEKEACWSNDKTAQSHNKKRAGHSFLEKKLFILEKEKKMLATGKEKLEQDARERAKRKTEQDKRNTELLEKLLGQLEKLKNEKESVVKENEAAKDILVENEKELEQLRGEREALAKENYIAKDAFLENRTELANLKNLLDKSREDYKELEERFNLLKGKFKVSEMDLEVSKNQLKISKMSKIYQKMREKRRKLDLLNSKEKKVEKTKRQKSHRTEDEQKLKQLEEGEIL